MLRIKKKDKVQVISGREKGKKALQECVNIAQNTLWQVYAWELLEKLGGT